MNNGVHVQTVVIEASEIGWCPMRNGGYSIISPVHFPDSATLDAKDFIPKFEGFELVLWRAFRGTTMYVILND